VSTEQERKRKREWARRFRANERPEAKAARNAKRRATRIRKRPQREPGQCVKCNRIFPLTSEFFTTVRKKKRDGSGWWTSFASECRECRNKRFRVFYDKDPIAGVARSVAYIRDNPHAKAAKNNRDMVRYMRRHGRECPPWVNHELIESLYAIARELTDRGYPHEVEHIHPIKHPRLCGLHVPWNLRVAPRALNQAKGNRLPFETGVVHDCTALLF